MKLLIALLLSFFASDALSTRFDRNENDRAPRGFTGKKCHIDGERKWISYTYDNGTVWWRNCLGTCQQLRAECRCARAGDRCIHAQSCCRGLTCVIKSHTIDDRMNPRFFAECELTGENSDISTHGLIRPLLRHGTGGIKCDRGRRLVPRRGSAIACLGKCEETLARCSPANPN